MRKPISFTLLLVLLFLLPNCGLLNRQITVKSGANSSTGDEKSLSNQLTGRYWKLVEINGKPITSDTNKEPHLLLFAEDNQVSGTGGCNGFSGRFISKESGRIQFINIMTTQMSCLNMETDAALYSVLEVADNYRLNVDTLMLNRAGMAPHASFVAVDKEQNSTL